MKNLRRKRKIKVLKHKIYNSINIFSLLSLIFYTSMIGVFFAPEATEAGDNHVYRLYGGQKDGDYVVGNICSQGEQSECYNECDEVPFRVTITNLLAGYYSVIVAHDYQDKDLNIGYTEFKNPSSSDNSATSVSFGTRTLEPAPNPTSSSMYYYPLNFTVVEEGDIQLDWIALLGDGAHEWTGAQLQVRLVEGIDGKNIGDKTVPISVAEDGCTEDSCTVDSDNYNDTLDMVDIGDGASEALHPITGWSAANIPGGYGGCNSYSPCTYRQIIEDPCTENERSATAVLHAGTNAVEYITIRHLDGISLMDSFEVWINSQHVVTWHDSTSVSSEVWRTTQFDISNYGFTGDLAIELKAIDPIWGSCTTYGQVAIDWISLEGCGETWQEPICGDGEVNQESEACDGDEPKACTTDEGYSGTQSCNMTPSLVGTPGELVIPMCQWNPCITQETCGDDIKNGDEECDGDDGIEGDQICSRSCTIINPAVINGHKVVCESEQYLPDWGVLDGAKPAGAPSVIDGNTAQDWVDQSDGHCWIDNQWVFGWAYDPASNPGDNNDSASWDTFTTADSLKLYDLGNGKIWLRESPNTNWVPFSSAVNVSEPEVSAEFYCGNDILNYDNYEWISGLQYGQEYHCVGFNTATDFEPASVKVCKVIDKDGILDTSDDQEIYTGWGMHLQKKTDDWTNYGPTQFTDEAEGCTTFTITEPGAYRVLENMPNGYINLNGGDTPGIFWLEQVQSGEQNYGHIFVNYYEGFCGDDIKNGDEECDGTDEIDPNTQTCTRTCQIIDYYELTKTDNKDTANPGETSTYEINFRYLVDMYTRGLQVVDQLPDYFTLDESSIIPADGVYDSDARTITWLLDTPADSYDFSFSGVIDNPMPLGTTTLDNIVELQQGVSIAVFSINGINNGLIQPLTLLTANDLTNVHQPAYCGDGNQDLGEECGEPGLDTPEHYTCDSCLLTYVPWCGDGEVNQESEECDGTEGITGDQTCSNECTIVEAEPEPEPEPEEKEPVIEEETAPVLTIVKSVESGTYYPGSKINYIVTVKNEGDETAYDVRLADTMPTGFTYDDGSEGAWFFGDLAVGKEMNHIYSVTAGLTVAPGTYTNTAQVSADNHDPVTDTADVVLIARPGVVLGAATVAGEEDELPQAGSDLGEYLLWVVSLAWVAFGAYGFRKLAVVKK